MSDRDGCRVDQDSAGGGAGVFGGAIDFSEFERPSYDQWKEAAVAALKGVPFDKAMYTPTFEGITLKPLYTSEDTEGLGGPRTYPGGLSSLRGIRASGYVARPWAIAQMCDGPSPREGNEQLRHELDRGASAIAFSVADTHGGTQPCDGRSNPMPRGIRLSGLSDLEALLADVDTERHPFHVHAGTSAAPLLGLLEAWTKKHRLPGSSLRGCIGADPLGYLLGHGQTSRDMDQIFDEMAHCIYWTGAHMSGMRTVLVDGGILHNGGASAVQELAFSMSAAVEAVRAMAVRHLDVHVFAASLRFQFSLGSHFFMEIAKIRAARVLWARIAESFGGDEAARRANIFGRTSLFTKTVHDPYVNMLRNTTEAFSGVIGGLDGLTVGSFDEAIRPGDEFSRRTARNTQLLLREEFDLLQPVDPAGGSWFIESLTWELARKSWALFQDTERAGGFLACARAGTIQAAVASTLEERFKRLAKRSDRAVGTNMYPNTAEQPMETEERGHGAVRRASKQGIPPLLEGISTRPLDGGALIPLLADAARSGATLEAMDAALDEGNDPEPAVEAIAPRRWTEQYEALRSRTERFRESSGDTVKVFLANMGPVPQHKARADFITGFMEVANFTVLKNDGFPTVEECAQAAATSGADVAVICSTDDSYPELVPPLARLIGEKKPGLPVYLAGAPREEFRQSYMDAGVSRFISVRSDCLAELTDLQKAKGML